MNMVRVFLTAAAAGLLCLAGVQCGMNPSPTSQTAKSMSVAFSIRTNQEFNRVAARAIVTVTAPDMDSIGQDMVITDSMMSATVQAVPVGKDRLFQIFVYDSFDIVRYYGSQKADIQPLTPTYVLIRLHKPTSGEVVVVGIIEDDTVPYPPYITVSTPSMVWPLVTRVSDPDTGAYVFVCDSAACSNGDPVEYGFSFYCQGMDSAATRWISGQYIHQYLTYPGTYMVQVRARDAFNPGIESGFSQPLWVTAISPYQIVVDTMPLDTIPIYMPD
jgi:hypothetical protein